MSPPDVGDLEAEMAAFVRGPQKAFYERIFSEAERRLIGRHVRLKWGRYAGREARITFVSHWFSDAIKFQAPPLRRDGYPGTLNSDDSKTLLRVADVEFLDKETWTDDGPEE